jgi:acyl-coenzyme A synthetase/AMP-(fatty) acid ligase
MITSLIFDRALRSPERTALIYNDDPWSYRRFAAAIASARGYFSRRGYTGHGYAVLAVEDVRCQWVLSLALRSLGLATIGLPHVTMMRMLSLPDMRCVVTSPEETWSGLEATCRDMGLPLLSTALPDEAPLGLGEPGTQPPEGANILSTSGTTGSFKLVMRGATDDAIACPRRAAICELTSTSLISVSRFPIFTGLGYGLPPAAWLVGGAVLISQRPLEPPALAHPGLTHAVTMPWMLARALAALPDGFRRNEALRLCVGGGAVTWTQLELAKARITPNIYNTFGGTEFGIVGFTRMDTPDDHRWHQIVPGRILEIVDDADRPLPPGHLGRLRVDTSDGPSGYVGDEALTSACFRNGFFYPGDLAIMRPDGRIALQGRVTDIINVNGRKLPVAPIEDRLCEALGIPGACLVSMQNDAGEEGLHVVLETTRQVESKRLNVALGPEISRFIGKVWVHYLATLPRTRTGKLMRPAVMATINAFGAHIDRGAEVASQAPPPDRALTGS